METTSCLSGRQSNKEVASYLAWMVLMIEVNRAPQVEEWDAKPIYPKVSTNRREEEEINRRRLPAVICLDMKKFKSRKQSAEVTR